MLTDISDRTLWTVLGDLNLRTPSPRYSWEDTTYRNDEAPSIVLRVNNQDTDVQIYFENDPDAGSDLVGCTVYFDGCPALNVPLSESLVAVAYACGLAELRVGA